MVYTANLPYEEVLLYAIGDLHIGAETVDIDVVKNYIRELAQEENAYFVFLGDLIDNAIIDSVGNVYKETESPHDALLNVVHILDMLRGRVLGIVSGNHEDRTTKKVGVDLLGLIAEERGIPYSSSILALIVAVNEGKARQSSLRRTCYNVVVGHGYGGGRTPGGKVNMASKLMEVITNADIYITGHTHMPAWTKHAHFEIDNRNKKLYLREKHLVTVPAFLGYEEYASKKFMAPTPFACVKIILDGMQKGIRVEVR